MPACSARSRSSRGFASIDRLYRHVTDHDGRAELSAPASNWATGAPDGSARRSRSAARPGIASFTAGQAERRGDLWRAVRAERGVGHAGSREEPAWLSAHVAARRRRP
jgi:hypothetical protein